LGAGSYAAPRQRLARRIARWTARCERRLARRRMRFDSCSAACPTAGAYRFGSRRARRLARWLARIASANASTHARRRARRLACIASADGSTLARRLPDGLRDASADGLDRDGPGGSLVCCFRRIVRSRRARRTADGSLVSLRRIVRSRRARRTARRLARGASADGADQDGPGVLPTARSYRFGGCQTARATSVSQVR